MELLNVLRTLSAAPGPSGLEGAAATAIADLWRPLSDTVTIDRMGNVIAVKQGSGDGPRRRLLLSAHMDEIGLMVTKIEAHNGYGFLRVTNIGGIDVRQVYGQRVTVHGRAPLVGVIGALPAGMLPEERKDKAYGYDDLLIDLGGSEQYVRANVRVGDFVTFRQPLLELQSGRVAGKALDNRACVAALTGALHYLQSRKHAWDIVFAATVQEETILLGGYTVPFEQRPDVAVALDVCQAKQPNVNDNGTFELGAGAILDIGVNIHPAVLDGLKQAAQRLEMTVNILPHTRHSGTETAAIQLTQAGIPTALVSIGLRYMHTVVETIVLQDVERTGRLVGEFAAGLNAAFLDGLADALLPRAKSV